MEEPVEEEISTVLMVDVAYETDDCLWMMDKAEKVHALQVEVGQLKEDKHHLQAEVQRREKVTKCFIIC